MVPAPKLERVMDHTEIQDCAGVKALFSFNAGFKEAAVIWYDSLGNRLDVTLDVLPHQRQILAKRIEAAVEGNKEIRKSKDAMHLVQTKLDILRK
jgi:hypothetical protein